MFVCRLREGQSVQIGDRTLTVLRIHRPGVATVTLDGGDRFGLLWDRETTILPDTNASVDRRKSFNDRISVHLSAPPAVKIRLFEHDRHPRPEGEP